MKVLVIGSGGREHAIAKQFNDSPSVEEVFVAPGNDGMIEATLVPIEETNVAALTDFALENQSDLTIVGPEMALVAGVVNSFNSKGLNP